jgi:hypothetical protein
MSEAHRVYFVPGMFGFGKIAGYDYFTDAAGLELLVEDVPTPPTSSLRYRARVLANTIARTAGADDGPIHLVGHSTGGLDVRLLLSPTVDLGNGREDWAWRGRVRSAAMLSSPHFGTPLAGYFATVSGTRVLYALSLLTVVSLTLGEPSLAIFSRVLSGVGGLDQLFGGDLRLFSRLTENVLRFVEREAREEIGEFLGKIRVDQGAIIQLMPEAMDLFNASTADADGVAYGCIVSCAPPPRSMRLARRIRSPYAALTAAIYSTLYQFTSQPPRVYPYARPTAREHEILGAGVGYDVTGESNDGIVPTLSMLHGELLWAGEADHLDVLGHFHDDFDPPKHVDWITSGSRCTRRRFNALLDALANFQLKAAPPG